MKTTDDNEDRYFDLKKLSAYSSLSIYVLREYIKDSNDPLPSYCIKRKILVKKSEFDAWVAQHRKITEPAFDLKAIVNDVLRKMDLPPKHTRSNRQKVKNDTTKR